MQLETRTGLWKEHSCGRLPLPLGAAAALLPRSCRRPAALQPRSSRSSPPSVDASRFKSAEAGRRSARTRTVPTYDQVREPLAACLPTTAAWYRRLPPPTAASRPGTDRRRLRSSPTARTRCPGDTRVWTPETLVAAAATNGFV
ncbi:hypothetical protein CDD80_4725 [Ophiocordyceps camponoti-rufipedis]|uniref:Uncharacterized protein n=1 Tax=Ophiocordyceps camponoti-rufipedis TaxID=2004952 RepID=A0A2C5YTR3_9HYPO|nr:hypothetical protein CDD80_4725 [Ophiocordyceps camponoti-rufipedis]